MTATSVSFTVHGAPQAKGSTRAFMPKGAKYPVVTSTNRNVASWEHLIRAEAQRHVLSGMLTDAVCVQALFVLPRPKRLRRGVESPHITRPDVDKLARALNDALTHVFWKDDGQIVELRASKRYANLNETPHVRVTVTDAVNEPA